MAGGLGSGAPDPRAGHRHRRPVISMPLMMVPLAEQCRGMGPRHKGAVKGSTVAHRGGGPGEAGLVSITDGNSIPRSVIPFYSPNAEYLSAAMTQIVRLPACRSIITAGFSVFARHRGHPDGSAASSIYVQIPWADLAWIGCGSARPLTVAHNLRADLAGTATSASGGGVSRESVPLPQAVSGVVRRSMRRKLGAGSARQETLSARQGRLRRPCR